MVHHNLGSPPSENLRCRGRRYDSVSFELDTAVFGRSTKQQVLSRFISAAAFSAT
ncbi:unnamed protein product, partial [Brassica rapa]